MSKVFAGERYLTLDKLMWLVRAVMSWDESATNVPRQAVAPRNSPRGEKGGETSTRSAPQTAVKSQ
ncbi:hypothetical protein [Streptomyces sp. NPDC050535]|uniref:hypothetical protein n=1 Tax=Streptomyces sp. NPDC050535 TaxID=3365626 RepID=UPI00379CDF16